MENTEPLTEEQPFAELSPSPLSGEGKEDVLIAANLKKTFRLSAKQRKIEKTPLRKDCGKRDFLQSEARRDLRAFGPQRRR